MLKWERTKNDSLDVMTFEISAIGVSAL